MRENRYKLIVYGKNVYREFVVDCNDVTSFKIGTNKNSNLRFNKDLFFEEFEFDMTYLSNTWQISCGENIYFTSDGVMKSLSRELKHGDVITAKYKSSNSELFRMSFFLDFDSVDRKYNKVIDVSKATSISVGGIETCDIFIDDVLLGKDYITVNRDNDELYIQDNNTKYGVYLNGEKIVEKRPIKLKNYDFFMIVGYSFYYKNGKIYTDNDKHIHIKNLTSMDIKEQKSQLLYPKFNRSTRKKYRLPSNEIEILSPKAMPSQQKQNFFLLIGPSLAMLALTIILRGVMGGGGTFVIYSAASMCITMIASVVTYIMKNKEIKRAIVKREEDYREYLQGKEEEIKSLRKEELKILRENYKSVDRNLEAMSAFDGNLFDRSNADEDFLQVRIGTGEREANCKIKYKPLDFQDKEDELANLPEITALRYRNLHNAPIISDFAKSDAVGVIGSEDKVYSFFKNTILDLSIRHFYNDVKMICIFNEKDCEKFAWLRWLKHINNDELGVRNLAYDEESNGAILEYIYSVLSEREKTSSEHRNIEYMPNFLVFIFDGSGIKKHPISKYIESGRKYGFTFIFFENAIELLPKGCKEIITLSDKSYSGERIKSDDGDNVYKFSYEPVSDEIIKDISLRTSPIYIDEVSLESDLTKNISLFELLGIMNVGDIDLEKRWSTSRIEKSMAAPLGVKIKNEVVYLDLHEKKHGPHGLVAGTTGSGKSELLQSYILSAATLFHPYELSFVIIDFKGGGMVNQFEKLPHLIGAITNIDGREIDRSLKSIKAELRKRQELFSQQKVNHINEYIRIYKEKRSIVPLPHLVIIVDEFAELKMEQPEFMKELISAARIGRSLGVHLILATQKPSGVVDSQIWSNSKFKLCLKVQTKEDSQEVIKTPLAAEIVEPGRAYLQVGNNEQFDLFQSAYSGAKVLEGNISAQNLFELHEVNLWGKRNLVFSNKHLGMVEGTKNQLQSIVEYIEEYCEQNNIPHLSGICLPPLKDVIYAEELVGTTKDIANGIVVTLGLYDDPGLQLQKELVVNLSESNTYIIGSAQSGKTAMLQTITKDLLATYNPNEVNVYIIDCGNMSMKVFSNSRIVGGVVLPNEEERVENLFKMLNEEINKRKSIFAQNMVGTYSAYIEAGFEDLPQIFLVIDNVTAFREYFPDCDNDLLVLSRDGQGVGINIIVTATQTNAISYKVLANFGTRVALNCNDKGEYSNIFDRCRMEPKEVAGRALYSLDKRIVEFQAALCIRGVKEIERTENLKKLINEYNDTYKTMKAKPIPEVPEIIKYSELYAENKELYNSKYNIPVGIGYDKIEYVYLDLLNTDMLAITGRDKSGKTNFIKYLMNVINRTIMLNMAEVYVIDSSNRSLEELDDYGFVEDYTIDVSESENILDDILEKLDERQEYLLENRGAASNEELLEKYPLIMLIIDNNNFIAEVSKDKELYAKFTRITKEYKHLKVSVIFSNIENATVAYSAPEMLKQIKENKRSIVFDDVANFKFMETSVKQQKEYNKPISLGDAYMYFGGELKKIKTIWNY